MPYQISELEIDAVSALPALERYAHFLKRVADWEELWSLRAGDAWVLSGDDDGERELVPVWPHPRYAEACATDAWAGAEPAAIRLGEWLDVWLPGMRGDRRGAAVFPVPGERGVAVEAERLRADLEAAAEPYE
ncbi:MAG TPA: DUF2750 domain-containing protein [Gemmatimonadaceae bacterium]|nr:DUF2750 domain-containing protein [Gemmatimonadaceae bacterium]